MLVSAKNVKQFDDVLLAPVAHWIQGGKLVIRVVRNLDTIWELTPEWQASSSSNSLLADLDEQHTPTVRGDDRLSLGLPFGDASVIARETDPVRKGYKILWNSQSAEGIVHDTLYRLDFSWMGPQTVSRRAKALYYRNVEVVPPAAPVEATIPPSAATASPTAAAPNATASPAPKQSAVPAGAPTGAPSTSASPVPASTAAALPTPMPTPMPTPVLIPSTMPSDLFRRDLLEFVAPPVVAGLAQISWRFRDAEEDLNWLHSPVIGHTRKLLPANRSDFLLAGSLTFDDLFVWATKPQQVVAKVVAEKVLLVPFSALTYYKVDAREVMGLEPMVPAGAVPKAEYAVTVNGYHQRSDGSYGMVLWNHETKQYPQLAPWVPTTVYFVPRRVWILELSPRDPYYLTGREVLVVDQESFLPVYRIVYDRIGDYLKTTVGGWGLGRSNDGRVAFPFSTFVLSVDRNEQAIVAVTADQVQTFLGKGGKAAAAVRDRLIPARERKAAVKPASTEDDESVEEEAGADDEEAAGADDEETTGADESADDEEADSADDEESDEPEEEPAPPPARKLPAASAPPAHAAPPAARRPRPEPADAEDGGF